MKVVRRDGVSGGCGNEVGVVNGGKSLVDDEGGSVLGRSLSK